MNGLRALAAVGVFGLAACASAPKAAVEETAAFVFPVIGDIPYSKEDAVLLEEKIIPAVKAGNYPFVIHVGDYKSGGAECTDDHDNAHAALIESLAPMPVFYTPGDNEWTDCDRKSDPATGKRYSELQRLDTVRTLLFADPVAAPPGLEYRRQRVQAENATWVYQGARFATLHAVGTNNGRNEIAGDDPADAAAAADARDSANLAWLNEVAAAAKKENARALIIAIQADMTVIASRLRGKACAGADAGREVQCDGFSALRAAIRDAAHAFGGPVLVIHGDTAPFSLSQSFAGAEADNLWRLNAAGDYGRNALGVAYGVQDATLVTVAPGAAQPFTARALISGAAAMKH